MLEIQTNLLHKSYKLTNVSQKKEKKFHSNIHYIV